MRTRRGAAGGPGTAARPDEVAAVSGEARTPVVEDGTPGDGGAAGGDGGADSEARPDRATAGSASAAQRLDALETAMDGVALYDRDLRLVYANAAYCDTFGADGPEELLEALSRAGAWHEVVEPSERARVRDEVLPTLWRSGRWRGRIRSVRLGGEPFEAEMSLARTEGDRFVAVVRDVTDEVRRRGALAAREQLFRLVAQHSTDLIALHELDGTFIYVSPSIRRLTGFESHEVLGELPWDLVHPAHVDRVRDCFEAAARGEAASASYRLRTRSGDHVWFETLAHPVHLSADRPDEVAQIESSSRDITARKQLERQLAHQALHDPLTGLPNRSLFMNRLRQAPARASRSGHLYGVLFLDLDRFKEINDTLGHAAGDDLLVGVAERLKERTRETDTVARLSGDEFAILLEELSDPEDAEVLAHRVLEGFAAPFEVGGGVVDVQPSLGVAVRGPPEEEPESLLRYADLAMYAAKRERGGSYRVYRGDRAGGEGRGLGRALASALEEDGLALVYQPLVRLDDGRSMGLEALLRWPREGDVSPPEILALAEKSGQMARLTDWVVRRACRDVAGWLPPDGDPGGLLLCLNVSPEEMARPGLAELLRDATEAAGIATHMLQIEIDAAALRRDAEGLEALKALGVRIALDDFGRDPVSLPLLGRLPVDALKMDPALVEALPEGDGAAGGARAVIGIGRRLGLEVTAEGIETEFQLQRLRELGCLTGQGHLISRPLPPSDVEPFLTRSVAASHAPAGRDLPDPAS